jgi:MFS superfamily sulfate permease-like transporter
MHTTTSKQDLGPIPTGDLADFQKYLRNDVVSGLLVFLIALPLCLGISIASGFPPLSGIFTAIIGSSVATLMSNSQMTIKGPAAGMIVIVLGCIQDFGGDGMSDGWSDVDAMAFRATLAVGVAAAAIQIGFAFLRGGIVGEFFPSAAVHGLLAAIGVIIVLKQFPVALGVSAKGQPLELLRQMPEYIMRANPAIAVIGMISLAIMFWWPIAGNKARFLRKIPSPMVVLLVSIPLGMFANLLEDHSYVIAGHEYKLGQQFLVPMPSQVFGMFREISTPNFTALAQAKAWWWVFLFFAIGSLESILSAKAVDLLDPCRRKTNMDRDLAAVGIGNLFASLIGGLPMISEIVRSRANIDNGAKTKFSNFWHGTFLLLCVGLIPSILHRIPLAALAAMLVYTGYRLAHPREFINVYRIGREQLVIFVATLIAVLLTDLLIGILIGIGIKMMFHVMNGVPLKSLFRPYLEIEQGDGNQCTIRAHESAVFSNWIPFRRQIEDLGLVQRQNITLDLSSTKLVDHSVMEKLSEMQETFVDEGLELKIVGLEGHSASGKHEMAARLGGLVRMRRLTILARASASEAIESICALHDFDSFSSQECRGRSQIHTANGDRTISNYVRVEIVGSSATCEAILSRLKSEAILDSSMTVYTEFIHLMRRQVASA